MKYRIFTHVVGLPAPQVEATGCFKTAEKSALEFSESPEVVRVVVQNTETLNCINYKDGRKLDGW